MPRTLRVSTALALASAAGLAGTLGWNSPARTRLAYLTLLLVVVALGILGHLLADPLMFSPGRFSVQFRRWAVVALAGLGAVAGLVLGTAILGPEDAPLAVALLVAAAVHSFACISAPDAVVNSFISAGVVPLAVLAGADSPWSVGFGLAWATCFAAVLSQAHAQELRTRVSHPPEFESGPSPAAGISGSWTRSLLPALATAAVLALLAIIVPPIRYSLSAPGDSTDRSPYGTSTQRPGRTPSSGTETPRPESTSGGGTSRGGNGEGDQPGRARGAGGEPGYVLDLNTVEEHGPSQIFAYVTAPEPRLMRVTAFTEYQGDTFRAPEGTGRRLVECPCTLSVDRERLAPYRDFEQLVEIVADYDGPLPAAFEPRKFAFVGNPGISVSAGGAATLVPSATLRRGAMYRVQSEVPLDSPADLRGIDGPVPSHIVAEGLQLPPRIPRRVKDLASEVTAGRSTPYEKAEAIIEYVVLRHRFSGPEEGKREGADAVDRYLFEKQMEGTGDDAVVAAVVMMRSVGVPARVGFGYRPRPLRTPLPGSPTGGVPGAAGISPQSPAAGLQPASPVFELDRAMRTTWVEFYVPTYGWVSADIQPRLGALRPAEKALKWWVAAVVAAVLLAIVVAALVWRRYARRARERAADEAHSLLRMLEEAVGIRRNLAQTPTEYGSVLWSMLPSADRGHAMTVISAVVQLSYTRESLSEDQRAAVYRALSELRSRRRERSQRARHAARRRRRPA